MPSCTNCSLSYDTNRRIPKVLPCGHTFCLSCVNSFIQSGEVQCPTDKTNYANDPNDFPTNYDLFNVSDPDEASQENGEMAQPTPGFSFFSRTLSKIFISSPNGNSFTIEIDLEETVRNLKEKIHQRIGTPPEQQNLFFSRHVLQQDAQTLSNYGLQNNSIVQMTTRTVGGI